MAQGKTRTFFAIDVVIGLALVVAGGSAVAFLIPYEAIDFATSSATPTFLGLTYGTWHTLHMYSGLVMIVGALLHFVLHWGWMTRVAKGFLPRAERNAAPSMSVAPAETATREVPDVG